jgi:hypothetical protein
MMPCCGRLLSRIVRGANPESKPLDVSNVLVYSMRGGSANWAQLDPRQRAATSEAFATSPIRRRSPVAWCHLVSLQKKILNSQNWKLAA